MPFGSRAIRFLAIAILSLALSSCDRGTSASPQRGTPVILISIDTLRSDHLPVYGYAHGATPNLDRFAADSIVFEKAFSHCPLTLPSHATMLTGLLPADTGVRDNIGFKLSPSVPTLGEMLKRNGYATAAAVSAYVLRHDTGIARGFDSYDDDTDPGAPNATIGRIQRKGEESIAVAQRWIDAHHGKPFFYFLHLYEPHTPYEPPEPYASHFSSQPYDGEIAWTDELVGRFLDQLRSSGIYDRALIIITSDHGEGLGDHKEDEHGIFLYREAIQVPLLLKLPHSALAHQRSSAPVQLTDIAPTILEMTASVGAHKMTGRSLLRSFRENDVTRTVYSETYYPRFHFGWSELHSMVGVQHHLIAGPSPELFDDRSDPREQQNVLEQNRRLYLSYRRQLDPLVHVAAAPAAVDPEEAAKLSALGYVGSIVSSSPNESLPDPRSRIDSFQQIRMAYTWYKRQEYEKALALVSTLLAENSRMLDLWDLKARSLAGLGRVAEAIEAAKQGLRVNPNASHLAVYIASLSLDLGRDEDAQKHAELVLRAEPGKAHELLARVAMKRKDLPRAEAEAKEALKSESDQVLALMTLGRIQKERGDYAGALARFDQARATLTRKKQRGVVELSFLRGDVLARLGRNAEAEAAFREEIAVFPTEPQAYKNLILLLVTEGRNDEATHLVFDLIKEAPTPPSYLAVTQVLKTIGDVQGARYWAIKGLERYPRDPQLQKAARAG